MTILILSFFILFIFYLYFLLIEILSPEIPNTVLNISIIALLTPVLPPPSHTTATPRITGFNSFIIIGYSLLPSLIVL
jgi:hypothetical protein